MDNRWMAIEVVPYRAEWRGQFETVAADLRRALGAVPYESIEHVGSTSVPGLAAKPILDIDVIVHPQDVPAAIRALEGAGHAHCGDLGMTGREAFDPPDDSPRRHVHVCVAGTLHMTNHLAAREVLRNRQDLRDEYGAIKLA
ncbi:MAG: GrpB family protein, partial [Actinomycetota bacterium]